jgi:hypothetical protein
MHGWEAVIEHRHIVLPLRQFRGKRRIFRWGKGVVFGGRHKGPPLTMAGVGYPLPPQRVPAEVRVRLNRFITRAGSFDARCNGEPAVQGEFAAIRLEEFLGVHYLCLTIPLRLMPPV